ncbi:MAG TPA: hypothetical protein IAD15_06760 [Candidatus Fimiplasma intestinipullorum]|uniref:Uncharacterized protein n=1 Tax=Candidatus Fimiplasma intestinipullorum TaxID=2840825 RepID=A0A9D1HQR1_9FIRM|nr:hypothetical protein [Candidatus Fimiplasma intestinipullorum]
MKKIVILCIVVIAGAFGFFKLAELANTKLNTMYYLASNSNGYFDERKDSVIFPTDNESLPLETIPTIKSNDTIKAVYPYYDLEIGTNDEYNNSVRKYEIQWELDGETQPFTIPYERDTNNPVNVLEPIAYIDENTLTSGRRIAHRFDCDSGIYVPEFILESFGLDKNEEANAVDIDSEHLTLHTQIMIPLATHMIHTGIPEMNFETGVERTIEFDAREVTQYKIIDYSFEIEGVIDQRDLFYSVIYYPYEQSKEIYDSVDKTVELAEDESLWVPNTYIVECNGDVGMEGLGNLLLEDIDHFILGEDEMEAQGDNDRMLFSRGGG